MPAPETLVLGPLLPSALAALERGFAVHRLWEQPDPDAYLREVGPRIRAIATSTSFARVTDALFAQLPALEIVASFGVGYDNVDAAAAAARSVVVTNTPGVLDEEVADLAVGLLIAAVRRIPQGDRFVREGRWPAGSFPLSPTLRGRTVGIVGLGNIGKAVARRLAGFDVALAYHGRARQPDVDLAYYPTLVGLAAACDVLVLTVPGGAGTRHLVDAAVLRALGADGILVNVARGTVVDEAALVAALRDEVILAAGLDVFADEPHVPAALVDLPNVVLLPHVGSASVATRAAMGRLLVENLERWFAEGRPVTPVSESRPLLAG